MAEPTAADAPESERLYTPEAGESQLTWRAVLAGCGLGGVVSAMNIYLGLRIGWSVGGSLIAAILGFGLFAALGKVGLLGRKYSVLETNITQTTGSAAGSMTSAAGLLAPIPALGMLGHDFTYVELTLWAFSVAYLGVFFAVPLRRQMVLVDKLRFPTGTATAETIMAMFSSGEEAMQKAKSLLFWAAVAGGFTLLTYFIPQLQLPPLEKIGLGVITVWTFTLYLGPMLGGAGLLIGPRVGSSLLLGAVVGWGVLAPFAASQGWAGGPEFDPETGWSKGLVMSYGSGVRGWILWPGVAIMVADALTSLALSWRTILNTFTSMKGGGDVEVEDDIAQGIPNSWWIGGLAIASMATIGVSKAIFDIPVHFTALAIVLSSVLATIAVRSTGETDINPIGGMGKVTQLVYGGLAPGMVTTNLLAAGVTGAGASQAGDMMQDLKTGYMLGASPKGQFKAQLIGIAAGILFCVPVYKLFDTAYNIGVDEQMPAPAAHAWKAMAELLSKGPEALPANAEWAVVGGLAFGILIPVLRKYVPAVGKYLPSALAVGIAMIVPAYYSITMFMGSMVLLAWQKMDPDQCKRLSFAVASGLIAGEGLMGIINAILTLIGVPTLT